MADAPDFEEVLLRLPRREKEVRAKTAVHKNRSSKINAGQMLTAVLKEQRVYLKQNKYAQELEAKYWHPRIKSMEHPVPPPPPQRHSRDFPVNDPGFTLSLKQRMDKEEGLTLSCPRLKSAPSSLPRTVLIRKLRATKGRLATERPNCPALPVRVFSPSKGSLFSKYSRVSLQPRPFTTGRTNRTAKGLSTSVVIPRQVMLEDAIVSRSISPESRQNTSGVNSRPTSRARLMQDLTR